MDMIAHYLQRVLLFAQISWVRDLLLLVVVSLLAYLPGWVSARQLRKRRARSVAKESRWTRLAYELFDVSLWPIWTLLLLASGFQIWVRFAPDTAGDPFRVLPILGFLLLYRILNTLVLELIPKGVRRRRLRRIAMPLIFLLAALQQLGVLGALLGWSATPMFTLGDQAVSLLSFLAACGVVLGFFIGARIVAALVGAKVLPNLGVEAALSEALATVLRYILVVWGFMTALDTLGFDLTALKIAFGALGVGVGFGLQNIVNNFVSGIILLFERTVKKGDVVRVGDMDARVLSIGVRSSVVRTRSGHEIIVPNSDLVTSQVTNYSFHDPAVRLDLPVGVSYNADPHLVREKLLEAAAEESKNFRLHPPPEVLFMGYGDSSLDFQLRVWVSSAWELPRQRSALYFTVWTKLADAGIEIPYPQRDLHVRSGELRVRAAVEGGSPSDASTPPAPTPEPPE